MTTELFDLHEKFENYMGRCFFEMKMEVSKRCIVLEDELGRRIEGLIKSRGKRSSCSEESRSTSKMTVTGSESAIKVTNKVHSANN